jgi:nucleoside-diphosphate kinase
MIEDTLVLIKPEGVQKGIIGDVISRFERAGMKIIGLKMVLPSEEIAEAHYPLTEEWATSLTSKTRESYTKKGVTPPKITDDPMVYGTQIQSWLKRHLKSGVIIAMVIRGNCAVEIVRKLVGSTDPKSAAAGTIRGDFSVDSYDLADSERRVIQNVIHASSSVEEARREIAVWFSKLVTYY